MYLTRHHRPEHTHLPEDRRGTSNHTQDKDYPSTNAASWPVLTQHTDITAAHLPPAESDTKKENENSNMKTCGTTGKPGSSFFLSCLVFAESLPSHHFGFGHESPIVINVISFTIPPSSLARTLGSELAAFPRICRFHYLLTIQVLLQHYIIIATHVALPALPHLADRSGSGPAMTDEGE